MFEKSGQKEALLYCTLLALQFGLQPMIANKFTSPKIPKASVVIGTEVGKIIIAASSIASEPSAAREKVLSEWSLSDSLKVAAVPAILYAIQNVMVQHGYRLLDSMTFNLLNQTKTLSAAFWLWVIMGQGQSPVQLVALVLLLGAAVLLNAPTMSSSSFAAFDRYSDYNLGLLMVLGASMLSGISAALTQRALVGSKSRHPLLFSAELAVYGIIFLLGNSLTSSVRERELIMSGSLFSEWGWTTLLPVTTNAMGGLIVGLVTKYAGGVVKGFALIAGIVITGIAQWFLDGKPLRQTDWIAVVMVSASIYLHASFPLKKAAPPPSSVKNVQDKIDSTKKST